MFAGQLAFKLGFMSECVLEGQKWNRARALRSRQKLLGIVAAILLGIALLAMADGLIAGMRQGSASLDMLPGQTLALSGPAATKNPLPSDLMASFTPADCPLRFDLEGFFTGYWFGSGMWRGKVYAQEETPEAQCRLTVAFRGMPAKSAQHYDICIFSSQDAMQRGALSLLMRISGINPFQAASWCAAIGLFFGVLTYVFGRFYIQALRGMQLLLFYSPARDGKAFLCVGPKMAFPNGRKDIAVFHENGELLGRATALEWQKGKWLLRMNDFSIPPDGALIDYGSRDRC